MLSIASAAVQTWGDAVRARLAATVERLEEALAAERHQLVLWAPVVLGAGVAAYFTLPRAPQWPAAVCVGLTFAAVGLAAPSLVGRCLRWGGLLFALGVGVAWLRAEQVAAPRLAEPQFARMITARVVALDLREAEGRYRILLEPDGPGMAARVRVSLRQAPADDVRPRARIRPRATLRRRPGRASRAVMTSPGARGSTVSAQ